MLVSSSNDVHLKPSNTVTITILLEGQVHNILYSWFPKCSYVFLISPVKNNNNEGSEREKEKEKEFSYF